jgi:membrane protein
VRNSRFLLNLSFAAALGVAASFVASRYPQSGSSRDEAYQDKAAHRTRAGDDAVNPAQIPASGWLDIARRSFHEVGRDRVLAVAAGVTFYALLALFPALTAIVSIYGLIAEPATIGEQIALADGFLPAGSTDFLREQVARITAAGDAKLGFALLVSLLLAIWSANAGVKAIFDALNVAYGEDEKRGFIRLNLVSLGFTVVILAFVVTALAGIAAVPILLDYLSFGGATEWLVSLARWPIMVLIMMLGLSALYRFGPSRDNAQWAWVSPGAVFASVTWLIASLAFSWYVANFEDYNETYGTVGAVIGLLTWMWLSATIVLVGAELNSEAERQTDKDTTEGPDMPIGMRGADAADKKQ